MAEGRMEAEVEVVVVVVGILGRGEKEERSLEGWALCNGGGGRGGWQAEGGSTRVVGFG